VDRCTRKGARVPNGEVWERIGESAVLFRAIGEGYGADGVLLLAYCDWNGNGHGASFIGGPAGSCFF
jgi:hypothetical protein